MKTDPLFCSDASTTPNDAVICRALFAAPDSALGEFMYMPGGLQRISPSQGGKAVTVEVMVDRTGAAALESQRLALQAKGKRPYFDFNHEDRQASFWPEAFFWRDSPAPGIYTRGEWTGSGKAGIEAKDWRQFSPVFFVDDVHAKPAKIICRDDARPNMGGLVNDPAFHSILPFWAKDTAGAHSGDNANTTENEMKLTPEQLAALQAKNAKLEQDIAALRAKADDASAQAELRIKEAELRAGRAEEQTAALLAKNNSLEASAKTRAEKDAKEAVQAAVARGAIPAKDEALQARWTQLITDNPDHAALLASQSGNPALNGGRVTPSGNGVAISVTDTRPAEVLRALGELSAKQLSASSIHEKAQIAKDVQALYAKDVYGNKDVQGCPLVAADSTDTNLGTLAGTLVAMRTIEDYEQQLVAPEFLTTDYSDVPGQFNQTTTTRIVVTPAVMGYDATLGADGRPKGYTITTQAQTIDAPVTLNQHKAVEINFSTEQLGGTVRDLFAEQANLAGYALALNVNTALLGNITAANFAGVAAGGSSPGTQPKVVALDDWGRAEFAIAASAFNPLGVPIPRRCCLMNSSYFGQLSQDPALTSLAVYQKPEIITGAELPPISKFQPLEASYLPTTGKLAAFFMHRSALIIQARIPNDYTQVLPGTSFGNVSVITGKSGLSFLLVQYVDHKGAFAGWRIAIMYGTAPGNKKGGYIIKSGV